MAVVLLSPGALRAGQDVQFWPEGNITAKLAPHWRAKFGTQSRLDDRGVPVEEHSDLGFAYTGIGEWLDLGVNYRVIFRKVAGEEWTSETRPHINATARFRLLGLAFSNRVRLEYNSLEKLSDFGTLRNKLSLNPPVYLAPARERPFLPHHKIRPFASYELFYFTDGGGVNRHRFQGGMSISFTDRVFLDLYYLRQENTATIGESGLNVVGANLKLLF
jgi:hypothetical protein